MSDAKANRTLSQKLAEAVGAKPLTEEQKAESNPRSVFARRSML